MEMPEVSRQSNPQAPPIPEMIGATTAPFNLNKGMSHVTLAMHAPTGPAFQRADRTPIRVFLKFENITASVRAPAFDIYLNLPDDAPEKHPELQAGALPMFGLVEASRSSERHPDNGLSYTQDVTNLFIRLATTPSWDPTKLRVTFVPRPWNDTIQVQVGRVSLVIG